ncbi:GNAT family N-acetyltransferase [Streptococcus sp. ZJ93]|uniref:GNAT family N-acetyltransferase n=1 Tax=Streptococcus handemini TaxID=3161188 RepID=UPI0032EF5CEC
MQIQHARLADLEQVHQIEQANFSLEEQITKDVLGYYLERENMTCLVMEDDGNVAGYLLALPTVQATVTDDLFERKKKVEASCSHLAIVSLSVAENYKGQGVGTLLLAAIKDIAVQVGYKGISLTCKDYLLSYYGMYQFEDLGVSESQFGGAVWYDMYWECP